MDTLDAIDPRRFDAEEIVDRLNEYRSLSDEDQEDALNAWEYSGLADAEHPLTALLAETHNACAVVRDLDGSLRLIFDDMRDGPWRIGPLYDAHMPGEGLFEEVVAQIDWIDPIDP